MIEKLGKAFPFLSILLIPIGLTKQIVFYYNYNVPIKNFIGLSEIGLLLADDILIVVPINLFVILFATILIEIQSDKEDTTPLVSDNQIPKKKSWFKVEYIFLAFAVTTLFFYFNIMESYLAVISIIVNVAFIILLIVLSFLWKYFVLVLPTLLDRVLFYCVFTTFMLTTYFTVHEITRVNNGKYNGTRIKTGTKEYISNDSIYYIGKTEKYIFFYNRKDKSTDIIPTDDIIEFKLKSK
jgi:amino acid permease